MQVIEEQTVPHIYTEPPEYLPRSGRMVGQSLTLPGLEPRTPELPIQTCPLRLNHSATLSGPQCIFTASYSRSDTFCFKSQADHNLPFSYEGVLPLPESSSASSRASSEELESTSQNRRSSGRSAKRVSPAKDEESKLGESDTVSAVLVEQVYNVCQWSV